MRPDQTLAFERVWSALDPNRRQSLIDELGELAEDNVELDFDSVFLLALNDPEPGVRCDAIKGLWEHDSRDLIDPLIQLLSNDPDAAVRAEAALALGRFVVQAEFDALSEADGGRIDRALRNTLDDVSEPAEVRARALEALGARSADWVHDLIEGAFDSEERRMRLSAVHAMGRSCDEGWLPTILPELQSDDPEMRYEAASALAVIADEEAVDHLVPLLHDDDTEVQEAAIAALGEIGGLNARDALEELLNDADERVRAAAVAALAQIEFEEDPLAVKFRG
jgi:HEAT repeat protein